MNQHNWNKRMWYILALTVLLCIATLVSVTGVSYARYQKEIKKTLSFTVASPARLYLGTEKMEIIQPEAQEEQKESTEIKVVRSFDPSWNPGWTNLEGDDSRQQLKFAVSNGISDKDFSSKHQQFTLQAVATLGATVATAEDGTPIPANCWLRVQGEEEGEYTDYPGVATLVGADTALGQKNGLSWVYTFYKNTEPQTELSWILEGGKLDYVTLTLIMEASIVAVSRVDPYVTGTLLSTT